MPAALRTFAQAVQEGSRLPATGIPAEDDDEAMGESEAQKSPEEAARRDKLREARSLLLAAGRQDLAD
eukprot:15017688-Alexandrium_andersonii.AAC.1